MTDAAITLLALEAAAKLAEEKYQTARRAFGMSNVAESDDAFRRLAEACDAADAADAAVREAHAIWEVEDFDAYVQSLEPQPVDDGLPF